MGPQYWKILKYPRALIRVAGHSVINYDLWQVAIIIDLGVNITYIKLFILQKATFYIISYNKLYNVFILITADIIN